MTCPEFIEVKDGLLTSPDNSIIKARDPNVFSDNIKKYFNRKIKISPREIEDRVWSVVVNTGRCCSRFDNKLFRYVENVVNSKEKSKDLLSFGEKTEWYLSEVPLDGYDTKYYPLFAKYKHGWVVLFPLEV